MRSYPPEQLSRRVWHVATLKLLQCSLATSETRSVTVSRRRRVSLRRSTRAASAVGAARKGVMGLCVPRACRPPAKALADQELCQMKAQASAKHGNRIRIQGLCTRRTICFVYCFAVTQLQVLLVCAFGDFSERSWVWNRDACFVEPPECMSASSATANAEEAGLATTKTCFLILAVASRWR